MSQRHIPMNKATPPNYCGNVDLKTFNQTEQQLQLFLYRRQLHYYLLKIKSISELEH